MSEDARDRVKQAIEDANTSGQWSGALDLIRVELVEPLEAEVERLREALTLAEHGLTSIAALTEPRRNPDGVEQGAAEAKLIAEDTLAALHPNKEKDE